MAVSGSYDYSVNRNEIITAAYRGNGMVAKGDDPSANEIADAVQTLNLMIKNGMGQPNYLLRGLKVWPRTRLSLTLSASKYEYSIKPSGGDLDAQIPLKIISMLRRTSDNIDTPMREITFEQHEAIGDKQATATPTRYYYERHLAEGKLFLDCYASDVTETGELTVIYPLQDVDGATDDFDCPAEWLEPLKYNLMIRLNVENGIPVSADLKDVAAQSTLLANSFEQEETSIYFQPGKDW